MIINYILLQGRRLLEFVYLFCIIAENDDYKPNLFKNIMIKLNV